jgi:uncharacterized protein with beta-barrel porin domain
VIFNANATTQISFNGNQGTVILGTGVTVTGNVITFAPDTGFVAFRGGGTLSGNAGTAALPLQQISLGGNSTITGSAAAQTFNLGLNTLNIGGPLTLASNPVLDVSINPTASGRILASGATNFPSAGSVGTVNVTPVSLITQHTTYEIINGGSGGNNTSVPFPWVADLTNNLARNAVAVNPAGTGDVFLSVDPALLSPLVPGSANANQRSVASGIDNGIISGGVITAPFVPLFSLTGSQLTSALSQLSGEAATGEQRAAFQLMSEFLGLLTDPFLNGRSTGGSLGPAPGFAAEDQDSLPPEIARAYDALVKASPRPVVPFDQRWSVWSAGFGGGNTTNGDPAIGSNNVRTQIYGGAVGVDYHFTPDTLAGIALAGAGTNWDLAQGLGGGRSDAFEVGVYGKTHAGPAYVAAAFAFANNWFDTNRFAAFGDQLTARFQGQSYGGRLEAGYRYAVAPAIGVIP